MICWFYCPPASQITQSLIDHDTNHYIFTILCRPDKILFSRILRWGKHASRIWRCTDTDFKICLYLRHHMSNNSRQNTFYVLRYDMWDMWKVCLQTFGHNRIRKKLTYFLENLQTLGANNSKILRIKKVKFLGYCFYMNPNL